VKAPLNDQTPEWFRDAKLGIWAHWGPQCQTGHGDWCVRNNGAKYFMALATHHDNSDNFNSKYQSWNSVVLATGPAAVGIAEVMPACSVDDAGRSLKLAF